MTQNILTVFLLAVQRELPRVWGRFDHQHPADGMDQLILVGAITALVALIIVVLFRDSRGQPRHFVSTNAGQLFRELCRAHGIDRANRRLLKRLAAARGLASPALVFVEPKHFDPSDLPANLQSSASDFERLRSQLFALPLAA